MSGWLAKIVIAVARSLTQDLTVSSDMKSGDAHSITCNLESCGEDKIHNPDCGMKYAQPDEVHSTSGNERVEVCATF
jgi:hypothetical protein